MKENYLVKTSLHYGVLSGISVFVFFVVIHLAGLNIFGAATWLGIWIPVVFIVLSMRFHRDHNLGGYITYFQAFSTGFMTACFSAALFGLLFYLFGSLMDGSILDSYKIQAEKSLEEGKMLLSESLYEKAVESIDMVTMSSLAFSESFNKLLGGVLISLVAAGICMRKNILGS